MKKVLFVATVVKTHINVFHIPYLKLFKEKGYETYVCARNDFVNKEECNIPYCDHYIDIPFSRTPLGKENINAYFMLKQVLENNKFEIIHCHTPVGGVLTRLAVRNLRIKNTKVIYTAHGFHFYKHGPVFNWIVFYPIERWLSKYTDILVTINSEDYERAKKFKARRVELVNGVGIKIPDKIFSKDEMNEKRKQLSACKDDIVLLSVGELIKRKNHSIVIEAIAKLNNPRIKYYICGSGVLEKELRGMIQKLHLEKQVFLLGFRKDINEICQMADIFIFPSLQEGLPVALMEAMANSLPVLASKIRGNIDLIKDENGGILFSPVSVEEVKKSISFLIDNSHLWEKMGKYNYLYVQRYSLEKVMPSMEKIYFG